MEEGAPPAANTPQKREEREEHGAEEMVEIPPEMLEDTHAQESNNIGSRSAAHKSPSPEEVVASPRLLGSEQKWWYTSAVLFVMVVSVCVTAVGALSPIVYLQSHTVPPFEGKIGFSEAEFRYSPTQYHVRYDIYHWERVPYLVELRPYFRGIQVLNIVSALLVTSLGALQCYRLWKYRVRLNENQRKTSYLTDSSCMTRYNLSLKILSGVAVFVLVVFYFLSILILQLGVVRVVPHLMEYFRGETGVVSIHVGPTRVLSIVGVLELALLVALLAFAIRTCIGASCQRRGCRCCGCSLAPDAEIETMP